MTSPHAETASGPALREFAAELDFPMDDFQVEACQALATAGIAAAPSFDADQVLADPHAAARHMFVEMERPDSRVPWLGEHTAAVLAAELGLDAETLARLREASVIS